jgi:hypothetical protein
VIFDISRRIGQARRGWRLGAATESQEAAH